MDSAYSRSPWFITELDDESHNGSAASLVDIEAGFSRNSNLTLFSHNNNLKNITVSSSPRFMRFYDARFVSNHQPHFLEACFLCKKFLGANRDIFMYRGDTPFCSEDCRQEQINMDETKEKKWSFSSSMNELKKKDQRKTSSSPSKSSTTSSTTSSQDYPFRTGTVAAA